MANDKKIKELKSGDPLDGYTLDETEYFVRGDKFTKTVLKIEEINRPISDVQREKAQIEKHIEKWTAELAKVQALLDAIEAAKPVEEPLIEDPPA